MTTGACTIAVQEPKLSASDATPRGRAPVVALAVATAFGIGYTPIASGTFGSAAGLVLWLALSSAPVIQAATIGLLFGIGAWTAGIAERHFEATDPAPVVIDEVMGMLITLFMNPVGWAGAVAAFVLFRIFDVIKPYPADRLERLPGGLGVMADDAMAAVYANIALRALLKLVSLLLPSAFCLWPLTLPFALHFSFYLLLFTFLCVQPLSLSAANC